MLARRPDLSDTKAHTRPEAVRYILVDYADGHCESFSQSRYHAERLKWKRAPVKPLVQKTTWSSAIGDSCSRTGSMVVLPEAGVLSRKFAE